MNPNEVIELMKKTDLFAEMHEEAIRGALNCLGFSCQNFARGSAIFPRDSGLTAGIMLEGSADLMLTRPNGRDIILRRVHPGESFVYRATADHTLIMSAVTDGELIFVHGDTIFDPACETCIHRRAIMKNIIGMQARENHFLYYKIALFTERSLRQKILHYFRYRDVEFRDPHALRLDRQSLADFLGSDRSALSRELSRMEREGLIRIAGRDIILLDKSEER